MSGPGALGAGHVVVPAALGGERLDRALSLLQGLSRGDAADRVARGLVSVDGRVVLQRSRRVREGEALAVRAAPPAGVSGALRPALSLVHVDDDLIVVDKQAGLVVHPGAGLQEPTLSGELSLRFPEISSVGDVERPGIVHRLDRGTSGLLVVARSQQAYTRLVADLAARRVRRGYVAMVLGTLADDEGTIDAPLARSRRDPTRMTVRAGGREARTHYRVTERFGGPRAMSLLEVHLETGRTHQIRVHMAAIGHPVAADARYGGADATLALGRPFLHAARLILRHPRSGEEMDWSSPLPDDLAKLLARLR